MMEGDVLIVARSMVETNGVDALALARRTAENHRRVGNTDRAAWWLRVAAAIEQVWLEAPEDERAAPASASSNLI